MYLECIRGPGPLLLWTAVTHFVLVFKHPAQTAFQRQHHALTWCFWCLWDRPQHVRPCDISRCRANCWSRQRALAWGAPGGL